MIIRSFSTLLKRVSVSSLIGMVVMLLMVACPEPDSSGGTVVITYEGNDVLNLLIPPAPGSSTIYTLNEAEPNNGSIADKVTFTLSNGEFKAATGDENTYTGIDISPTDVPTGLTPRVKRTSPTEVEISFSGQAEDHVSPDKDNPRVEILKLNLINLVKKPSGLTVSDLEVTLKIQFLSENLIRTADELQKINDHLNGHFVLANGIDLTDVNWIPIGRPLERDKPFDNQNFLHLRKSNESLVFLQDAPFSGIFDGKGQTIKNLKIGSSKTDNAGDYTGLFGKTNGATITNLIIDHSGIWGGNAVGTLVGEAKNTKIIGVSMKSTVGAAVSGKDIGSYAGGLVGSAGGSTVNGYTTGDVSGTQEVGGLVGFARNATTVSGHATGNVSGTRLVGGLVGSAGGSTVNGYTTGDVSGETNVGGLVGKAYKSIVSGHTTGNIRGYTPVGGLVGNAEFNTVVIGYATGNVSGTRRVGGLVGEAKYRGTVKGYVMGKVSGVKKVGGLVGLTDSWGSKATTVRGYTRGVVEREKSGEEEKTFGLLVGDKTKADVTGYPSSESRFEGISKEDTTGNNGTTVIISTVNNDNYQTTFAGFTFGAQVGEWSWVGTKKWPAINLPPEMSGNFAPDDQPTGPK